MDTIFIDTSIFEANNFLESRRIREILKLSEDGYIRIIMPELTYNEILNRIKRNISEAALKFNKFRKETRILRNIDSLSQQFNEINENDCNIELFNKIKSTFKKSKIKIIDYPSISIKEVFDSYFNKTAPFSKGLKKDEFPDAFTLATIKDWCEKNNKKCKVFSKDQDLVLYDNELLETKLDFEKYLDDKLKEIANKERLERVKRSFENKSEYLIEQISIWTHDELNDANKYSNYTNNSHVDNIEILTVDIDLEKYQITSITDSFISIQVDVYLRFEVEISFDDMQFATYDKEDNYWYNVDNKKETVGGILTIPVDMIFKNPLAGEKFAELEIDNINDGKDLEI